MLVNAEVALVMLMRCVQIHWVVLTVLALLDTQETVLQPATVSN